MDNEHYKIEKGKRGEEAVFCELKNIFGENAIFFKNVIVASPTKDDINQFECDIICVSKRGVFVFEVKNWEGYIEADMLSKKWGVKKSYNGSFVQYDNPILQNNIHKRVVSELLNVDVVSIVVMNNIGNKVIIKKHSENDVNIPVLYTTELKNYFDSHYNNIIYSEQQIYNLFSTLKDMEFNSKLLKDSLWQFNNQKASATESVIDTGNTSKTDNAIQHNKIPIINKTQTVNIDTPVLNNNYKLQYDYLDQKKTKGKSVKKLIAVLSIIVLLSLIITYLSKALPIKTAKGEQETSDIAEIVVPETVMNRYRYSVEELQNMPVVSHNNGYLDSKIKLKQSIVHYVQQESYVENHETKYKEAKVYITPVEFINGVEAENYYSYLNAKYNYSHNLSKADHEYFAAIRFYVWFVNDDITNIEFKREAREESNYSFNKMLKFYLNDTYFQNQYLSNETGQIKYLKGFYCEDIEENAISNSMIISGVPVECIYLVPLSSDFEYSILVNPQPYMGIERAVLSLN
ncbi:MAG: NERD domain-containing protein [Ruminococcaceae bacterium]|nr:NERD domain-containing protein [Oscillospiraceae bacterium]